MAENTGFFMTNHTKAYEDGAAQMNIVPTRCTGVRISETQDLIFSYFGFNRN